jgi:glycogen(starch) synthase
MVLDKNSTVLGIVGPYPPHIGGTASFLSHFVPLLEDEGFQCVVFNTQKGQPDSGIIERLSRLFFFSYLAGKVLFSPCKIIHCHAVNWSNLIGHAIILTANRPFKKTVLTLHAGDLLAKITGKRTRFIARWMLRLPHVVTTVTPELRDAALKMGIRQVFFIPNDLSYVDAAAGSISEEVQRFLGVHRPVIVSVGALERVHGIDVLVRAVPALKTVYPELGVVVIAYKSINLAYQGEIKALVSGLNLEDAIIFPDDLPDVLVVVKQASVFVRPALSDGDSIAVREALALGLPVVASQTGFRPQGVLLFPPGDAGQLAARIKEALTLPGQPLVTTDSSSMTIQRYLDVYTLALQN